MRLLFLALNTSARHGFDGVSGCHSCNFPVLEKDGAIQMQPECEVSQVMGFPNKSKRSREQVQKWVGVFSTSSDSSLQMKQSKTITSCRASPSLNILRGVGFQKQDTQLDITPGSPPSCAVLLGINNATQLKCKTSSRGGKEHSLER